MLNFVSFQKWSPDLADGVVVPAGDGGSAGGAGVVGEGAGVGAGGAAAVGHAVVVAEVVGGAGRRRRRGPTAHDVVPVAVLQAVPLRALGRRCKKVILEPGVRLVG